MNNQINHLYNIIIQLQNDSTKTGKERIIKTNLDNELFVKVMQFLVNPFITTGLSTKKISKRVGFSIASPTTDFPTMLDYVAKHNTGSDKIISEVQSFINSYSEIEYREMIEDIFTKSLKVGVDSLWNKSVPNNLKVPEFGCMLAKSYADHMDKVKGNFILTKKEDGNRILIIRDFNGAKAFTRSGKEYEGLELLLGEINLMGMKNDFVLDGELLADIEGSTDEVFSETQSLARGKGRNKQGLKFRAFDIISLNDFKNGKSKDSAIERKSRLHNDFFGVYGSLLQSFEEVEVLYQGNDISMIDKLMIELVEPNGWEGLMINLDLPYVTKRTDALLKVKKFHTVDLKIIGFEEGDGKYKDVLGAVHVDYKGYDVGVGSGFTDEQRRYFWDNRESLFNRVVEIKYFEESKNQNGGISLRFPTFVKLREEDKEVSYN